tara:strand:- start:24198 stop:24455 length:258 start_codon:yes stop_codon:yes gene_type:complete
MIQGLIVKFLLGKIMEAIEKADDKRIARKHHREIKELKKEVKSLKKDSHPVADWVCLECGCKAKRKETPRMRRKKRRQKRKGDSK